MHFLIWGPRVKGQQLLDTCHVACFMFSRGRGKEHMRGRVSSKLLHRHGAPHIPLAKERHMAKPKVNGVERTLHLQGSGSVAKKGVSN